MFLAGGNLCPDVSIWIRDLSDRANLVKEKTKHAIRPAWMTRGSDEEALQDFVRAVEDDLKRFQVRAPESFEHS